MSESNPTYSSNPILSGIEHIGHWAHEGESAVIDVAEKLPTVVVLVNDLEADASSTLPAIGKVFVDAEKLVGDGSTDTAAFLKATASIWAAYAAAFVNGVFNPTAFLAAIVDTVQGLPTIEGQATTFANLPTDFNALVADLQAAGGAITADWNKLQADAKQL